MEDEMGRRRWRRKGKRMGDRKEEGGGRRKGEAGGRGGMGDALENQNLCRLTSIVSDVSRDLNRIGKKNLE